MGGSQYDDEWVLPSADITLVLVGKLGYGKSATGNSILGREAFVSEYSHSGVTNTCQLGSTTLMDGRTINVIDTPGKTSISMLFLSVQSVGLFGVVNSWFGVPRFGHVPHFTLPVFFLWFVTSILYHRSIIVIMMFAIWAHGLLLYLSIQTEERSHLLPSHLACWCIVQCLHEVVYSLKLTFILIELDACYYHMKKCHCYEGLFILWRSFSSWQKKFTI
jgi:hypothetical protein